ncbi:hypothetical protein FGIG_10136 [Fasciola gigantica]|uniref:Uncharacterized protein n=1 Tax=Fasciola gigantica TaxID=46835 RepID=A0A504YJ96_FASGI|nr:hypothetical protein FGIG_10136 [Fasciola gigantica]
MSVSNFDKRKLYYAPISDLIQTLPYGVIIFFFPLILFCNRVLKMYGPISQLINILLVVAIWCVQPSRTTGSDTIYDFEALSIDHELIPLTKYK